MSDDVVENDLWRLDDAATRSSTERSDVERERDEYLDALQRLQADFENYRKRVARSSEDAASRAAGDLVAKMLPVLDAFDLAAAHFAAGADPEEADGADPGARAAARHAGARRASSASTPSASPSTPRCTTPSRTSRR